MSWGLDAAEKELRDEIKRAGLKVDLQSHILVTDTVAIKMKYGEQTRYYLKILRDAINRAKAAEKARLQAKQQSLL